MDETFLRISQTNHKTALKVKYKGSLDKHPGLREPWWGCEIARIPVFWTYLSFSPRFMGAKPPGF